MRSIQSLIFVRLFFINIIFFAVVSVTAYFLTSETIKQFAVTDASTSLLFIVDNIEGNYKSELNALDEIATGQGFLPFDQGAAQAIVKEFLELPNIFTTVHLYRTDGQLLFAERRLSYDSSPYKPKTNFNAKEARFIELAKKVIEEKKSVNSEAFFTWAGVPYQTYITPVFDDAKKTHVSGILSGGVFPRRKKIEYLLQGLKLSNDNFILLTDSQGNYITSDGVSEKDAASTLKEHAKEAADHFFKQAGADPDKVFVKHGLVLGSSSFYVMSLPISNLNLVVTLGFNTRPIDQKTRELSNKLFFALVVGFLLSLFASVLVGERLSRPFREMARTVNEINTGNFAARNEYGGKDEIGYLSALINTLADKIEKSQYLGNLWSNETELAEQKAAGQQKKPDEKSQTEKGQIEKTQNEALQNEAVQNKAVQNKAVQNEAVQNEAVQNEAVQNEAVQSEKTSVAKISGGDASITENTADKSTGL